MNIKSKLTILILSFTTILLSQNKTIDVDTSWNGRMCNGSHGLCYVDITANKKTANAKISFNKGNNELTLFFPKILGKKNKLKILNNELEKDFYLYEFEQDFILPNELKIALNITKLTKIKQGNYLVKIVKDQIIMKLKLE